MCWPESQVWKALSLRWTSFNASVTTCEGEHSRYSAYFVSVDRASSSRRSCTTVVLGCLGGAFRSAIRVSPSCIWNCFFLHSDLLTSLYARGQNTVTLPARRAGATPKNFGRLKAVTSGVAPAHPRVLPACRCHLLPLRMCRSLKSLRCS